MGQLKVRELAVKKQEAKVVKNNKMQLKNIRSKKGWKTKGEKKGRSQETKEMQVKTKAQAAAALRLRAALEATTETQGEQDIGKQIEQNHKAANPEKSLQSGSVDINKLMKTVDARILSSKPI